MQNNQSAQERIQTLKAEIQSLESAALQELNDRRTALTNELASVESQIAALTGEPANKSRSSARASKPAGKQISFELLKTMLKDFPGKTMNLRKEGYDSKQVKSLAMAYPESLKFSSKGPWPTITLIAGNAKI